MSLAAQPLAALMYILLHIRVYYHHCAVYIVYFIFFTFDLLIYLVIVYNLAL